ncbi:stealth conserved region 3 domain-containing protein [Leisingera thetidis]|uniref:stealth conserved region 3 domain-containing protein n=1 Tax=Leisingera thetidis TaxID=2930199 RepID=UPI0021F742E6|nr:stealth conserved region 3 domain-containing protein [Leisingera thetidis]
MTRLPLADHLLAALGNPALAREAAGKLLARRRGRRRPEAPAAPAALGLAAADGCGRRLVAALAAHLGVLRLADDGWRQWIGVSAASFAPVLQALQQAAPEASLHPLGQAGRLTPGQALKAGALRLRLTGRAGSALIDLERYEPRGPGHWVSANAANAVARALFSDCLEAPGLQEAEQLAGAPSPEQLRDRLPVDLVCTWVSHADPGWQQLYAAHAGSYRGGTDAAAMTRFHSNDELRFLLRSAAWNLPWLRRIHVVSNCAPPDWLDRGHPGIAWVDHAAVLAPADLPTFNSHAIEAGLHRIPGLSRRFLYANDDMFFCRPQEKAGFFAASGASLAFLEPGAMACGALAPAAPDYLNAARVSAGLLQQVFGVRVARLHQHVPYALNRELLREIAERFPDAIARTRASRFRSPGDVNMTSFLYHHYALLQGKAQEGRIEAVFARSSDLRWRQQLERARRRGCDVLCLNEGGTRPPGRDWHRHSRRCLQRMFPHPAPWERASGARP